MHPLILVMITTTSFGTTPTRLSYISTTVMSTEVCAWVPTSVPIQDLDNSVYELRLISTS